MSTIKVFFLICIFIFVKGDQSASDAANKNSSTIDRLIGYHLKVGVPEAERIKIKEGVNSRISGGYSSYRGEHPYMAGLLITLTTGQTSICGGTLVSSRRVVTAASCWYDGYSQGSSILVVLGSVYLYSGGTRVYASTIYQHPYFNPYNSANDIAVLVIPYVSTDNYIRPAQLPYGSYLTNTFTGSTLEAIGYGRTNEGSAITSSQYLKDIFLTVISNTECEAYYGSYVTTGTLCTSGSGGKGPCGGDMGGPLVHRLNGYNDVLVGVITFGSASGCQAGHPTAYTRVPVYNNWIRSLL